LKSRSPIPHSAAQPLPSAISHLQSAGAPPLLLTHFARISNAPDAIPRLRQFILDLAVRGKLVPQDAREQPASELLGCIRLERDRQAKEGTITMEESLLSGKASELQFNVRPGWTPATIRQILLSLQTGPFGSSLHQSDYQTGGVPVINPASIQAQRIVPIPTMAVGPKTLDRLATFKLRAGDIVMARRGEMGRCAVVTKSEEGWLCGTGSLILRLPTCVFPRFLVTLIGSPLVREYLGGSAVGATMQNLNQSILLSLVVGLPPLAEQHRIVAKVDELMALCDRLEAAQAERETRRTRLVAATHAQLVVPKPREGGPTFFVNTLSRLTARPTDIPQLRQTILKLAVRGELVPQDPNDEPAVRVLRSIDNTPTKVMRTRTTDENEGEPSAQSERLFEPPDGWEWVQFRRLPIQASVGIDRGRSMQGPEKAFAYFKMNNIRNSGGTDLSDVTRIDATPDEVEAFSLADGDFLFNTRNSRELVGKTCVFRPTTGAPVLYNNNILRVQLITGFSPEFLDYWFRSLPGKDELEKLKSNTTNVCAIYQGKLSGFPCPFPPLAEQHRIVAKVDELMALCNRLEAQLTTTQTHSRRLLESTLHQALNGRL
jgi:type I restriction enzyme S subunit